MHVLSDNETLLLNHCCRGKAKSITYFCVCECVRACVCAWKSVCVCAYALACASARVSLLMQHVTRMRHVFVSASLASPYFSTLSHKCQNFRKRKLLKIKCDLVFSTAFT
jgi:hypothetical protein